VQDLAQPVLKLEEMEAIKSMDHRGWRTQVGGRQEESGRVLGGLSRNICLPIVCLHPV